MMTQSIDTTRGCRTYNGKDANADPGVNAQTKDGRGNIAPVTIILPTLAMEADGDVEKFMKQRICLKKDSIGFASRILHQHDLCMKMVP